MMKELNKHKLIEALNNLPQYEPKGQVWEAIERGLLKDQKEAVLQKSISQLPDYEPPAMVWENIQSQLDQDQKPVARVFNLRKWAAAAAIFIAVSSGLWLLYNANHAHTNGALVTISYSEEKVAAAFLNINWEEDEDAFAMVAEFCKKAHIACNQPDFKIMTEELDELNAAKEELKEAMDHFGNDPDLIAQLTVIEHERSDLLKKIIKRI